MPTDAVPMATAVTGSPLAGSTSHGFRLPGLSRTRDWFDTSMTAYRSFSSSYVTGRPRVPLSSGRELIPSITWRVRPNMFVIIVAGRLAGPRVMGEQPRQSSRGKEKTRFSYVRECVVFLLRRALSLFGAR